MLAEVDDRLADGDDRDAVARAVWRRHLPCTERELAEQGLGFFTYVVRPEPDIRAPIPADSRGAGAPRALRELVDAGVLVPEPIVYEDFLPRSAAGIFRSNLDGTGTRVEERSADLGDRPDRTGFPESLSGPPYDLGRLSDLLGAPVHDPMDLYAAEQERSVRAAEAGLGICTRKAPA
jgi:uncharacterized glyoxalase superfamily metalloenzyme YdcJ